MPESAMITLLAQGDHLSIADVGSRMSVVAGDELIASTLMAAN